MHSITKSLQFIYNKHAKHFSQTRKKRRPEIDHIIDYINTIQKKTINILELGCWDGRLYKFLQTRTKKNIHYTGIDIADKLLEIAKKNNPEWRFIHADMIDEITKNKQESVDIIISIASFHHIPTHKDRLFILKNAYRILQYEWTIIMTNRALSHRFIKKYRKSLGHAILQNLLSLGQRSWRDVYITRNKQWKRYYHIFNKNYLESLVKQSWFTIRAHHYITAKWWESNTNKNARNIFTIGKKTIKT